MKGIGDFFGCVAVCIGVLFCGMLVFRWPILFLMGLWTAYMIWG